MPGARCERARAARAPREAELAWSAGDVVACVGRGHTPTIGMGVCGIAVGRHRHVERRRQCGVYDGEVYGRWADLACCLARDSGTGNRVSHLLRTRAHSAGAFAWRMPGDGLCGGG
jgi:hypothetical protein